MNAIIFFTSRFRSGSTMLWNIFRRLENVHAFYEPLHDELKTLIRFPGPVQAEHYFVKSYFDDYASVSQAISLHQSTFAFDRLYLESSDSHVELKNYLDALIAAVPDQTLGFFKFNRIDFRLGWIKKQYPQIPLLHLVRNPRDLWQSSLGIFRPVVDREIDANYYFITTWARDLYQQFPFLASPQIEHSYQRFYYLWKLSWLAGKRTADLSVNYEDLLANPEQGVAEILKVSGIYSEQNLKASIKYILSSPERSWTHDRPAAWFMELEQKCDAVLDQCGLLEHFALKPLTEIQNASPFYLSMLNNQRNDRWVMKSFKQTISDGTKYAYEVDYARKNESKVFANRLEELEKASDIQNHEIVRLNALNEKLNQGYSDLNKNYVEIGQALNGAVQEKARIDQDLQNERAKAAELSLMLERVIQGKGPMPPDVESRNKRTSPLEADYDNFLNSRSYRLTAFLRSLMRRLRIFREDLKRMTGRQRVM